MPSLARTVEIIDANVQNIGTPATTSGLTVTVIKNRGNAFYKRTDIAFSYTGNLSDNGSVNGSSANVKLYDFPTQFIETLGGMGSLTLTGNSTNTSATAAAVMSLGTAAAGTDNATLTTTEANIASSTAYTLSSRTKSAVLTPNATPSIIDGSTTNASLYLNVAIPASSSTGSNSITVSGFVKVTWVDIGSLTAPAL